MRVLMICPELPTADAAGSMAPAARQFESLRRIGIETEVIDLRGIPMLKYAQALPRVRRISRQVDLIHAHFGYCGWLGWLAQVAIRQRKPLVMSFMGDDLLGTPCNIQGDLEWFSKVMVRANKRLAYRAAEVIVKSEEMAQVVRPCPATVIPNGVDTTVFQPQAREQACEQLNLDPSGIRVLFPGDPDNPRKGFDLASRAIHEANARRSETIELVPLWNVAPNDVPLYMNACQAMVMTSLIEGSPNVVKEAMACDTPIVAVSVGDVEAQLHDDSGNIVPGYAVCPRDAGQIASSLNAAIDAEEVCGRKRIFELGLDLPTVAERIRAIYWQALGREPVEQAQSWTPKSVEESMNPTSTPMSPQS